MPSQNRGDYGRSGGFGAAVASVARDIGRALGIGGGKTGPGANRGGLGSLIGGPSTGALGLPFGNAPSRPSVVGADRGGPDRSERQVAAPVAMPAPAPVTSPVQPGATAPGTPVPPGAPAPVVPGDMTSTGAAEDAALASAQKGRAATIATGAQGLLAEGADQLRRRRSLVGGGLIA